MQVLIFQSSFKTNKPYQLQNWKNAHCQWILNVDYKVKHPVQDYSVLELVRIVNSLPDFGFR